MRRAKWLAERAARLQARVDKVASDSAVGTSSSDAAFWSAQPARKAPSGVAELLAADRADPARWLREASITPGRAAALAPGAPISLCYYGT